jgi:hypothetical protein
LQLDASDSFDISFFANQAVLHKLKVSFGMSVPDKSRDPK